MSVVGSLFFFLTTNFAVWIIWDFYPKTFEGLISCYTLAIPFFQNTIISTCFFSIILTFLSKYLIKINNISVNVIDKMLKY